MGWLLAGEETGAVHEDRASYNLSAEAVAIAKWLDENPRWRGIVGGAMRSDAKLRRLAREMAASSGISEEAALAQLLAMRSAKAR